MIHHSPSSDRKKQELYRDARFTDQYEDIWQSVGKCVFCDLKEKYIFFEENNVVMTISLFAYIDGHFMIIPRRHIRSIKDLTQLEWETVRKFSYIAKKIIKEVHGIRGMQLVFKDGSDAQSTVSEHIHFHCVPFDAPDLSQWNYRKLQYTPLENKELYQRARQKIITSYIKYEKKYHRPTALPVVCDLLILNKNQELLLQERKPEYAFISGNLCLPGGRVSDFTKSFEEELLREVKEETALEFKPNQVALLHSSISEVTYAQRDKHLKVKYPSAQRFVWNVYHLIQPVDHPKLIPGDDCERFVWVALKDIPNHKRISAGIKSVVSRLERL